MNALAGMLLSSLAKPAAMYIVFNVKGSVFEKVLMTPVEVRQIGFKSLLDTAIQCDTGHCSTVTGMSLKRQSLQDVCVHFEKCQFVECHSKAYGGACEVTSGQVTFVACIFEKCFAEYGGAIWSSRVQRFSVNDTTLVKNRATRFGSVYCDCAEKKITSLFSSTNISHSTGTKFISGVRVESCCPVLKFVSVSNTHSPEFGAIWDWSARPNIALYDHCMFYNTSSDGPGGAITMYHWMHQSVIDNCHFRLGKGEKPVYVYVWSTESKVDIRNCYFDVQLQDAIGERFGNNEILVTHSNQFVPNINTIEGL